MKKGSFTIIFMHGADVNASVATKCLRVALLGDGGGGREARDGHGGWAEHIPVFIRFNGANTMSALANALCKCASRSTLAQLGKGEAGRGRK